MVTARTARSWGRLGLHVVLLLVGLGLLQVVAERTNRRFDLTPARTLSVSPLTLKVLEEVSGPCKITVFFRRGTREQYAEMLARLRDANPRVEFELLDLDRYPERGRSVGVTQYGRAAIEYAGRRVVVAAMPEAELAGGLLHAVRGQTRRLFFTTGHGERMPGGEPTSYGRLAAALGAENYSPDGLSLLDGPVPAGVDIVIVAGPKRDLLAAELDALASYLKAGGGVLMLLDPGPLPALSRFLASMGIRLGDDLIVDREKRILGTDGLVAVVELFKRGNPVSDAGANPIETGAVLPSARTVDVATAVPGVQAESVARTAPSAWTMADPARARRGEEPSEAAHDVQGPASLVVVAEVGGMEAGDPDGNGRPPGQRAGRPLAGRLVVVGDADLASDAYLDLLGNRDLVLNAVAWAAGEPALAGPRPAEMAEVVRPLSPVVLTTRQARAIFAAGVIVQPAAMLALGLTVVWLRRRRG